MKSLGQASVLIVEDEVIIARDIENKLSTMGYGVAGIVFSGEEAIDRAREQKPDLVLMDIVIKGNVDGIRAADHIYNQFHIPVVYLTAYADDATLERAKVTEPFGYILKPFDERELRSVIEMALYKHRTSQELRRSEEKYRTIVETIEDGYFEVDRAGNMQFFNDSLCRILGFSRDEMRGMNNRSYMDEENAGRVYKGFNSVYRSGKAAAFDWEITRKDGELRFVEASVTPVWNSVEKPVGFRGIVRDVTERRMAERELKKSYERLQVTLEGTILALASMVEIRDSYTAGHQKRVAKLAVAIAQRMKLTEEQVQGIQMAALVHDIGKIKVPAEILSKPGRLTGTEFEFIQSHPAAGHEILKSIEFPWPIADIVLQHHERLDGSGYGVGKKGDEILLEAKILAVADVVEAMSSHRPYRPSLGLVSAIDEITKNQNILYDPEVVDSCLALLDENADILD